MPSSSFSVAENNEPEPFFSELGIEAVREETIGLERADGDAAPNHSRYAALVERLLGKVGAVVDGWTAVRTRAAVSDGSTAQRTFSARRIHC